MTEERRFDCPELGFWNMTDAGMVASLKEDAAKGDAYAAACLRARGIDSPRTEPAMFGTPDSAAALAATIQQATAPRFLLNPSIVSIRRRLERCELDHLREHAAEQAERIEDLERELRWADQCADMWQRTAEAAQEHLDDGAHIGITVDGAVGIVVDEAVWSPS
jgi:hypothetical protein